LHRIWNY